MNAKKNKTDENDFNALDRVARQITPKKLRQLMPEQLRRWKAAKRIAPKRTPPVDATQSFDEILKPIRADFRKSGITEDQLDEIVDRARRATFRKPTKARR